MAGDLHSYSFVCMTGEAGDPNPRLRGFVITECLFDVALQEAASGLPQLFSSKLCDCWARHEYGKLHVDSFRVDAQTNCQSSLLRIRRVASSTISAFDGCISSADFFGGCFSRELYHLQTPTK
jgi:hypothetical protein